MDIKNTEPTPASNEIDLDIEVSASTIAAHKHNKINQDAIRYRKKFQIGCDGVSGEAGGADAADHTAKRLEKILSEEANLDANDAQSKITKALYDIDKEIKTGSTTATIVYISEGKDRRQKAIIVNIGDSRVYLFRKKEKTEPLEEVTLDSNIIKENYPEAEARRLQKVFSNTIHGSDLSKTDRDIYNDLFRYTNVVYQSVGSGRINAEITTRDLQDGDRLLICTDGLTTNLTDSEIEKILRETSDNEETTKKLLAAAIESKRNDDDISFILADVQKKKEL